jgi:hypothetical protein
VESHQGRRWQRRRTAGLRQEGPHDHQRRRNDLEWRGPGEVYTIVIDPAKKPATIDIRPKKGGERTVLGIYEFDKDTLKMALSDRGKSRPKDFTPGADTKVLVLQPDKK